MGTSRAKPKGATRAPRTRGAGAEAVYRALRLAIIEQTLLPGTKLPEDAIARRFLVSRTLVREALARLAGDALVTLKPNRGAFVARPTLAEARDVFEVRRGLERMVTEMLTGTLTAAQRSALYAHVHDEENAQGRDGPQSIRLAGDFHIMLAAMTGNALLQRYVAEVGSRCSLILAASGRPHSTDCAVSEHRQLIAAIAGGERARAVALMDRHLRSVLDRALVPAPRESDIGELLAPYVRN